jgi:glycosyltransferase involved in cell wall biosynthesis
MNNIRVCIVCDNLPPAYSGAGQQALTLASALTRIGVPAIVIGKTHHGLPTHQATDDVEVFRVSAFTPASGSRSLESLLTVGRLFARLIALRRQYDRILFFDPEGGFKNAWIILPLLHLCGKRTAARMTLMDSSDPAALRRKRFGYIRLFPYRLHHRIISVSTALSLSYEAVFGSRARLTFIPNGVDTTRFHPISAETKALLKAQLGLNPEYRYCTVVGRISYRKGFDIIIEAWREVASRFPDARLLLIGPWEDSYRRIGESSFIAGLQQRLEAWDLRSTVTWLGPSHEVERYLQASDVFLFASRREGCPNALLEAMASGLPIVSTRIDHITDDLITNETNGLITRSAPNEFAMAVNRVLGSPDLARSLGTRAVETAQREFAIESVAKRYAATLASV